MPDLKRKSNSTSNEFLINLRFFVTFPLGSDFSIWKAKKEIGGMFRRNAEPAMQDCAHRLFSFLENISNPCNSGGRLIRIQNVATKTGCTPRQRSHNKRKHFILILQTSQTGGSGLFAVPRSGRGGKVLLRFQQLADGIARRRWRGWGSAGGRSYWCGYRKHRHPRSR